MQKPRHLILSTLSNCRRLIRISVLFIVSLLEKIIFCLGNVELQFVIACHELKLSSSLLIILYKVLTFSCLKTSMSSAYSIRSSIC